MCHHDERGFTLGPICGIERQIHGNDGVFMAVIGTIEGKFTRRNGCRCCSFLLYVVMVGVLVGLTGNFSHATFFSAARPGSSEVGNIARGAIPEPILTFTRTIKAGDTLSAIFDRYHISTRVLLQLLSADESILALDVLRPGHRLTFTLDQENRSLVSMKLLIHPGKSVIYKRVDDCTFEYEEVITPGTWEEELLDGTISSSFYQSARSAGLTDHETGTIIELFRDQIQFTRRIRVGDRFQVIRSRQFIDGVFTGQSRIEGVRIFRGSRVYSAFLFDDGNYYDSEGDSLERALRRYPMAGHYRVSSRFNPARRHPITNRIVPHYGVDFAMPSGTSVLSIGDGVVTRIHKHPFAGIYLEIRHGRHYASRYLHLSRVLVRRGQTVKRGDRIALSGSTGRSTAPHLHYELHIGGRPVNPLTAKIPTRVAVPGTRREAFNRRVAELVATMEQSSRKLALRHTKDRS